MDYDGKEDKYVHLNSGLDDNSLVEEMMNISQHQGKPTIQNDNYHNVNKSVYKEEIIFGRHRVLFILGR